MGKRTGKKAARKNGEKPEKSRGKCERERKASGRGNGRGRKEEPAMRLEMS